MAADEVMPEIEKAILQSGEYSEELKVKVITYLKANQVSDEKTNKKLKELFSNEEFAEAITYIWNNQYELDDQEDDEKQGPKKKKFEDKLAALKKHSVTPIKDHYSVFKVQGFRRMFKISRGPSLRDELDNAHRIKCAEYLKDRADKSGFALRVPEKKCFFVPPLAGFELPKLTVVAEAIIVMPINPSEELMDKYFSFLMQEPSLPGDLKLRGGDTNAIVDRDGIVICWDTDYCPWRVGTISEERLYGITH